MSVGDHDLERLRAWVEVIDDSNYYEILGVLDLADVAAIKAAFHELALAFHPDVYADAPEELSDMARTLFRRVAEAYRVLSAPELRARYDLALAQGHLRLANADAGSRSRPPGALKSLEDLCRSPAARLSAQKADVHIGHGELEDARRLLKEAFFQDGSDNPELEERIEALDVALFAKGG